MSYDPCQLGIPTAEETAGPLYQVQKYLVSPELFRHNLRLKTIPDPFLAMGQGIAQWYTAETTCERIRALGELSMALCNVASVCSIWLGEIQSIDKIRAERCGDYNVELMRLFGMIMNRARVNMPIDRDILVAMMSLLDWIAEEDLKVSGGVSTVANSICQQLYGNIF